MTTRNDFETGFSRLGENIDTMFSDARKDYKQERQGLKDKWNQLNTKREKITDTSDGAWEEVKDEMEEEWKDVKNTYEDIKRKMSGSHEKHSH